MKFIGRIMIRFVIGAAEDLSKRNGHNITYSDK